MQNAKKVQSHAACLKKLLPHHFTPAFGIILGTGLSNLADEVHNAIQIPYRAIPDFPVSTVLSHTGQFVAGELWGIPVLLQQGRCHLYEGRTPEEVVAGVRVMRLLGAKALIVTNAAGSINPLIPSGSLMAITDHINMTGQSPLTGNNENSFGPRFPDMSQVYNGTFRTLLRESALRKGICLHQGVYLGIAGPQLETPAETRAFRTMGADAVGMSTVLEVIAAIHMGMRVAGIACLTNQNLPDAMQAATIEEIVLTANTCGSTLATLLESALPSMALNIGTS